MRRRSTRPVPTTSLFAPLGVLRQPIPTIPAIAGVDGTKHSGDRQRLRAAAAINRIGWGAGELDEFPYAGRGIPWLLSNLGILGDAHFPGGVALPTPRRRGRRATRTAQSEMLKPALHINSRAPRRGSNSPAQGNALGSQSVSFTQALKGRDSSVVAPLQG
jgi:hypothetical protein